jgi:hypothetical protein
MRNARVNTRMIHEDFSRQELERKDPVYPYNILVMAHRPDESELITLFDVHPMRKRQRELLRTVGDNENSCCRS